MLNISLIWWWQWSYINWVRFMISSKLASNTAPHILFFPRTCKAETNRALKFPQNSPKTKNKKKQGAKSFFELRRLLKKLNRVLFFSKQQPGCVENGLLCKFFLMYEIRVLFSGYSSGVAKICCSWPVPILFVWYYRVNKN